MSFSDMENVEQWKKDAVQWAIDNGLVKGYPDGTFKPDNPITRAEMCVILFRALGENIKPKPTNPEPQPEPEIPGEEPTFPKKEMTLDEIKDKLTKASVLIEINEKYGSKHGTGTILKNGLILTAKHVTEGASEIKITTKNHGVFIAKPMGEHPDKKADISIYKIDATKGVIDSLPYIDVTFDGVESMDQVYVVGNPGNRRWDFKYGDVTDLSTPNSYVPWEFKANIEAEKGISGAGVVNKYCELVGVMTHIISTWKREGGKIKNVPGSANQDLSHSSIKNWIKFYLQ